MVVRLRFCGVEATGGVLFGILMQMMDMIPMVAMLVGSESTGVGWLVHLAISAFIGATYALLFARWADRLATGAVAGLGMAWCGGSSAR